jgi:lipid-binding SYLF domain-containing protein
MLHSQSLRRVAMLCGLAALLAAAPAVAQSDEAERLAKSTEVLDSLVTATDDGIPEHILARAEAIVIIPTLMKGGFVVGAQHGKGVMAVRNGTTWSFPSFVSLNGGSLGWQIGLESVDMVLLVMNKSGIDDLMKSEFKLGADASVAAGPVGRSAEASTDARMAAKILAYSRAKGLFAGATIQGASLKDDEDANRRFYGRAVTPQDLFAGEPPIAPPPSAQTWRSHIASVINGVRTTNR